MRYFLIVFVMSVFVIAYVWQNIEIMKFKMDYKRLVKTEQVLAEKNARLKYEFERLRNFKNIEANAGRRNLVKINPASSVILKTEDDGNKK